MLNLWMQRTIFSKIIFIYILYLIISKMILFVLKNSILVIILKYIYDDFTYKMNLL